MEELRKFEFGTIVCDGCARRFDSKFDDERLRDLDELLDYELEEHEWKEQSDGKWFCPECAKDPKHRTHPGEGRIIVDRMTLSGLRCDCCGNEFENYEGYSCWEDSSETEEKAREDDWIDIDGKMEKLLLDYDCLEVGERIVRWIRRTWKTFIIDIRYMLRNPRKSEVPCDEGPAPCCLTAENEDTDDGK